MTPHLRGQVRAYVDRSLPEPVLRCFDRHVVYCMTCRAAADQERRIVASLRADADVPQGLRSALLGLGSTSPAGRPAGPAWGPRSSGAAHDPMAPEAPSGIRMPPSPVREAIPTVPPQAPALHRSPMRAALFASLAAGASVAVAWSLAAAPLPTAGVVRQPAPRAPSGVASIGTVAVTPAEADSRTNRLTAVAGRSQSTSFPGVVSRVGTTVSTAWLLAGSAAAASSASSATGAEPPRGRAALDTSAAAVVDPARGLIAFPAPSGP